MCLTLSAAMPHAFMTHVTPNSWGQLAGNSKGHGKTHTSFHLSSDSWEMTILGHYLKGGAGHSTVFPVTRQMVELEWHLCQKGVSHKKTPANINDDDDLDMNCMHSPHVDL